MTSSDHGSPSASPARSFGGVAEAYERGRPGYPAKAASWLVGAPARPLSVLELGAGTGKLTEALVALGHDVHATEPDPAMLDLLARKLPDVRLSQASAEDLPLADETYDVVVAAQCFHWFDPERALPEIGRVLRHGGLLSLVWNLRDERVPWVRRLGPLLGTQDQVHRGDGSADALEGTPWFGDVERSSFTTWQSVDRSTIKDLALSRSNIASLDAADREQRLADVLAFYDEYGRGMDGMRVPYVTECFRTRLVSREGLRPEPEAPVEADDAGDADGADRSSADAGSADAVSDGTDVRPSLAGEEPPEEPPTDDDSGVLLIDFR